MDRDPDIVATTLEHDRGYWGGHPDVVRLEWRGREIDKVGEGENGEAGDLRIWLRPGAEDEDETVRAPRRRSQARACDLELFGVGEVHLTFWDRCPGAKRVEVFQEIESTEEFPDGWWCVRLWLAAAIAVAV